MCISLLDCNTLRTCGSNTKHLNKKTTELLFITLSSVWLPIEQHDGTVFAARVIVISSAFLKNFS